MWVILRKMSARRKLCALSRTYDETARGLMLMRHMNAYFDAAHRRALRHQKNEESSDD